MELDIFLRGEAFDAYEYFGAHISDSGVVFRVYAPRAERVNIMAEFTGWQEQTMHQLPGGVWEYSCNWAHAGRMYKYVVYGDYILINDDPKRRITKSALEKALTIKNPTPAKIEEENIWGPSYVYGIITDNRIV